MHDVFDRLENRTLASREGALFRDLQHLLTISKSRAPALRAQLKGIDIATLRTRADLPRVPLRRRADILAAQAETTPFGGYVATRVANLAQVFGGPGAMATPAGQAKDWWGMARGFYAAGLRKGTLVLNAFPYDLDPHGHMAEAGARALGCPVLAAGAAEPARTVEAIFRFRPTFFCGTAERLRGILDHALDAAADVACLTSAVVTGPLKFGLRQEFRLRGVAARHALVLPEIGLVAYESGTTEGLCLAEGLILELVEPATGLPVEPGAEGEMVLTRINHDYPLLRFATGLKARILAQASTCGRTNTRLLLSGDPTAAGDRHIREIRARHPDLRMLLTFAADTPHLKVEHRRDEPGLRAFLGETLSSVLRRTGIVEIVQPGTLPDDEVAAAPLKP